MNPICFQEEKQEDNISQTPGDGVSPGYRLKYRVESDSQSYIDDPEDAPEDKHIYHRNDSFSTSSHDAGSAVGKGQNTIKKRNDVGVNGPIFYCLSFLRKDPQKIRSKQIGKEPY